MATPFREPAESPTQVALARLEALPANPLRRACAALVSYREIATAPANPMLRSVAAHIGFKELGCAAEHRIPRSFSKRILVDAPRTTQAHVSQRGYFLVTYFESGKCIITWDHPPRTASNALLQSRSTAGSFEADYALHVEAVSATTATDTPIVVSNIRTAVTLGRLYYLRVASPAVVANVLLWPLTLLFAIAVLLKLIA